MVTKITKSYLPKVDPETVIEEKHTHAHTHTHTHSEIGYVPFYATMTIIDSVFAC